MKFSAKQAKTLLPRELRLTYGWRDVLAEAIEFEGDVQEINCVDILALARESRISRVRRCISLAERSVGEVERYGSRRCRAKTDATEMVGMAGVAGPVDRAYLVSVEGLRDICDALDDEKRSPRS